MYLSSFTLKNFRSCVSTQVSFCADLTILTGANNSGKSNVLDALRLFTEPSDGRRSRYADESDISRGSGDDFTVSGVYSKVSEAQSGLMISATACSDTAKYQMHYSRPRPGKRYSRVRFTSGEKRVPDPEPGARRRIRHVYLPALRDASRVLSSGSSDRIAFILRQLAGEDAIQAFVDASSAALTTIERDDAVAATNKKIGDTLGSLTQGVRPQEAALRFADASLSSLARGLRFRMADRGIEPSDLVESGLGYANLLYMATIIVELQSAKDADLTLFLVEEPEAHLHPQLQSIVLEFLRTQASSSGSDDTTQPEGRIQVIVTTHSPGLAAAVPVKHINVLHNPTPSSMPSRAGDSNPLRPIGSTSAVLVQELGLPRKTLSKIDRYLDATRSPMLFSRRVLLVEGIAEAILLPVIARQCLFKNKKEGLAKFIGTPMVAIGGVDFEPYVRFLLTPNSGGHRLSDKVVVVTDRDPTAPGDRPKALSALAKELGASDSLSVFVAEPTLEPELLAGNHKSFTAAVLTLHPRSAEDWNAVLKSEDAASECVLFFKNKRTLKGDFAQEFSQVITESDDFKVPEYLESALYCLIGESS